MRFAHFFVDRPIFAAVISILFLVVGSIAYTQLPVSQYPEIAPPTIVVRTSYPGADPQTIADTVSTPLEQQINGVEDMLYMSSYSSADGAMSLTITFKLVPISTRSRCSFRTAFPSPFPVFPRKSSGLASPPIKAHRI